ncbi:MAG: hypothetical protein NW224_29965 [Leptolyngbyaceae cyanobacterium bins.302]|nr:hypothetical protein [Leptolyngbyaceae cyanobacterium bins.302]
MTFPSNKTFTSLDEVIKNLEYFDSPEKFFSNFPDAWNRLKYQVLKLETRQEYLEPGNPSFELMAAGDFDAAIKLIPEVKAGDAELYETLSTKGVDFIRCRPVIYPFSQYLKWEFETYKFSAEKAERIFCCSRSEIGIVYDNIATKDFMVFDSSVGFIHNYDTNGLIQGGWKVTNVEDILLLQSIFIYIKSFCLPFNKFFEYLT